MRENLERRHLGRGRCGARKFERVRNPCSKTQCEGGFHATERFFPLADGSVKLGRKTSSIPNIDVLQGESDGSQPLDDFWSISGNHNCRHHVQHRAKLHAPKELSFPLPLKYVDVAKRTNTTMDLLLEGRIERQLER